MNKFIERVVMTLRDRGSDHLHQVYIDVFDNNLSRRWLKALINVIELNLHLEKNYCFMGFPDSKRDGTYLCDQINHSIHAINRSGIGYNIDDCFCLDDIMPSSYEINNDRLNRLHRYFEDLQGVSGAMSLFYHRADAETRWHIRQLNLLCHEFETWALSWRKQHTAPDWVRPSQLMCWLGAPRFVLQDTDLELFGIDSLYRDLGGVYLGVNKAIGKHHWEVFQDEGGASKIETLTTTSLRSQTEAAADFDIEWARDTRGYRWMDLQLNQFREWLRRNEFDPDDPALTIGHPKVGQIDLEASLGGRDVSRIWQVLDQHMDVYTVSVAGVTAMYDYHWQDHNYMQQQIQALGGK